MDKKKTLIQFIQQAQIDSGELRTEQLDGKEWLIAPSVIIVEGVLNGSYVPAGEIEISTFSWNGRPLPVHHPPSPKSANDPDIIENQVIGYFHFPEFKENAIHGEMWFDVAKANQLGGDAQITMETIQNGGIIEVSTSYWAWMQNQSGEFNGEKYDNITMHILPDHVAVLPGDEGACNVNDGCGVPRINQQKEKPMNYFLMHDSQRIELDLTCPNPTDSERQAIDHRSNVEGMSFRDVGRALRSAVDNVTQIASDHWIWIEDIFDDYFVYEIEVNGDSDAEGLWRRDYSINPSTLEVTLSTERPVVRKTVYEDVPQSTTQNVFSQVKEFVNNLFQNHTKEMDMKNMIDAIVQNGTSGLTAEQLAEFPESAVTAVYNGLQLNEESDAEEAPASDSGQAVEPASDDAPSWAQSLIDDVKGLSTRVDDLASTANAATEQEKSSLVAQLAQNSQCPFDKSELQDLSLNHLKKLSVSYIKPDYSGLSFGSNDNDGDGYEYVGLVPNAVDEEAK